MLIRRKIEATYLLREERQMGQRNKRVGKKQSNIGKHIKRYRVLLFLEVLLGFRVILSYKGLFGRKFGKD
jgi:hypothetical protein